jgi:hypothetical protein
MNTNTIHKAVQIPSGFGMPVCGHALPMTSSAAFGTTAVVREPATAAKGDMGLIAYVPGPTAWSPPPS